MKTNRSLIGYILLTIITFGIYPFFFWHSYVNDVNTMCQADGKHTNGYFVMILLTIITLGIYSFVWSYGMQNRLRDYGERVHLQIKGGKSVVLWSLFGPLLFGVGGLVATYIQFDSINSVAYRYNQGTNA